MTKEELGKEAEEWLCNNLHSASEEDFIKAMVDIAEPREKRIAELEKENANLKALRKYELNVAKLEIEKLEKENEKYVKENTKAKELLKQWLQTSKAGGCDNINIVTDTEQFLKENKYDR